MRYHFGITHNHCALWSDSKEKKLSHFSTQLFKLGPTQRKNQCLCVLVIHQMTIHTKGTERKPRTKRRPKIIWFFTFRMLYTKAILSLLLRRFDFRGSILFYSWMEICRKQSSKPPVVYHGNIGVFFFFFQLNKLINLITINPINYKAFWTFNLIK